MDFGDAPVIAGDQAVEDLGQPDPRLPVDAAHDAEIDRRQPPIRQREQIALVEIGVKKPSITAWRRKARTRVAAQRLEVVARGDQRVAIG